jgi:AraC-like DNA-binding protein
LALCMLDLIKVCGIDPCVRMLRLKRSAPHDGKRKDEDNVFSYIAAGVAEFQVDGIKYRLSAGDAIIIPPYRTYTIRSQGDVPLVQYIVHFDLFETPQYAGIERKAVPDRTAAVRFCGYEMPIGEKTVVAHIPAEERVEFVRIIFRMQGEFQNDRPARAAMLKACCTELLIKTLRSCEDAVPGPADQDAGMPETKRTKAWVHIENAADYIRRHAAEQDLDNERIAEAIGVTPNHLTTVFRQYTGFSLHRFMVGIKVEKAQQLMLTGRFNVTEAAEQAGFSSVHVFSKTFKSVFGVSPTEFMDRTVSREQLPGRGQTGERMH